MRPLLSRTFLVAVALLSGSSLAVAAEPAHTLTNSSSEYGRATPARPVIGMAPLGVGFVRGQITAVGDSVMVDYQDELAKDLPGVSVHAYVGQQFVSGLDELQTLRAARQLGAIVVVALGTNGPISPSQMTQMLATLNGAERIIFVTNFVDRPWQNANNQLIFATARAHPHIVIANWAARARRHPDWLYFDHTHLPIDGTGARELAWIIRQAVHRP